MTTTQHTKPLAFNEAPVLTDFQVAHAIHELKDAAFVLTYLPVKPGEPENWKRAAKIIRTNFGYLHYEAKDIYYATRYIVRFIDMRALAVVTDKEIRNLTAEHVAWQLTDALSTAGTRIGPGGLDVKVSNRLGCAYLEYGCGHNDMPEEMVTGLVELFSDTEVKEIMNESIVKTNRIPYDTEENNFIRIGLLDPDTMQAGFKSGEVRAIMEKADALLPAKNKHHESADKIITGLLDVDDMLVYGGSQCTSDEDDAEGEGDGASDETDAEEEEDDQTDFEDENAFHRTAQENCNYLQVVNIFPFSTCDIAEMVAKREGRTEYYFEIMSKSFFHNTMYFEALRQNVAKRISTETSFLHFACKVTAGDSNEGLIKLSVETEFDFDILRVWLSTVFFRKVWPALCADESKILKQVNSAGKSVSLMLAQTSRISQF